MILKLKKYYYRKLVLKILLIRQSYIEVSIGGQINVVSIYFIGKYVVLQSKEICLEVFVFRKCDKDVNKCDDLGGKYV